MRSDQFLVSVSIETSPGSGKLTKITDPWDKMSGGNVTSSETKHRPGGMGPERTLGGVVSVENVTVERDYVLERDHDLAKSLGSRVGRARMRVAKQPLTVDGVPAGRPTVYVGILMGVNYPDSDSTSTSVAMLSLTMSTDGTVD